MNLMTARQGVPERALPIWSNCLAMAYSTVTDFARLRGWSTSVPLATAV